MKEDIIIKRDGYGFDVWVGDKHTEQITYEEMLGVITSLCINEKNCAMYNNWFKTDEEHERYRKWLKDTAYTPGPTE